MSSVQNLCWLMISSGIILPFIYWKLVHNPIEKTRIKPTRIQWNERGILNQPLYPYKSLWIPRNGWWNIIPGRFDRFTGRTHFPPWPAGCLEKAVDMCPLEHGAAGSGSPWPVKSPKGLGFHAPKCRQIDVTLWLFNIAMENPLWMQVLMGKPCSMAMSNYQMVMLNEYAIEPSQKNGWSVGSLEIWDHYHRNSILVARCSGMFFLAYDMLIHPHHIS